MSEAKRQVAVRPRHRPPGDRPAQLDAERAEHMVDAPGVSSADTASEAVDLALAAF